MAPPTVRAHESAPAVLALRELESSRFVFKWTPPAPIPVAVTVELPEGCAAAGARRIVLGPSVAGSFGQGSIGDSGNELVCGEQGLSGELVFTFDAAAASERVAVTLHTLAGQDELYLSSGTPQRVGLKAHAAERSPADVAKEYIALGVEHILSGADHLLFLLGLLLLVNGFKILLATVSAFTLAHSVTLAAAALGVVSVPTAPVEICIALSVLLLAVEAAGSKATATRRWPWAVAFAFGLLHGLGFASALAEVGLPQRGIAVALLGFNFGVELGQLGVVLAVAAGYQWLKRRAALEQGVRSGATWLLGIASVYWLLERLQAWLA